MIDWDALVLAPVMAAFGEGDPVMPATLPLYSPRGLIAFYLRDAVFDQQYEQVDVNPEDGSTSTNRMPVLGVRLSLFPRPPLQSDTLFIPATPQNMLPGTGQLYVVKDVQSDGHGHAKLVLMERAQ